MAATKTTTFVHDNNQVIEEYSSSFGSSPDKLYVYANYIDDPLMMESAGERFYYIKDRQFNITALTNAQGEVVEQYNYNAFGLMTVTNATGVPQPKTAIGNYYGYTGRYFDQETGLWYYRNRMYNPELNRFLQRDPSGYVDGINLYAYAKNNPLRYLDAMGLKSITLRNAPQNNNTEDPNNWKEKWKKETNAKVFVEESGVQEHWVTEVGVPAAIVTGPQILAAGLSAGESTVLYSGPGAKALAAASTGIPIFETVIGRTMNWVESSLEVKLPQTVWDIASRIYASNARGIVQAFITESNYNSTFARIEAPIIEALEALGKAEMVYK